jgi:hypothetical protein
MSTAEVPQTRSVDLVKLLAPIWGAGLLLFYGSVAFFNEDAFSSGGALLLLISLGVGASLLLSPWLRRAGGLIALGLACLWAVTSVILHRHDLPLLVWALVWGTVAYALPGLSLVHGGGFSVQLKTTRQAVVTVIGLVALVLFLIACMFGLGIS